MTHRPRTLVLFAGRMIPEKQAPLAVSRRSPARAARIQELRGVLLGDGPSARRCSTAIAAHGLRQSVSAPGFAAAETVDAEMRRALCLLLPSVREGYGMVVVEAAARGTPSIVVAGPDNAAIELIEEGVNGFVCRELGPETDRRGDRASARGGHRAAREHRALVCAANARALSLEGSLQTVLASYGEGSESDPTPSARRSCRASRARCAAR